MCSLRLTLCAGAVVAAALAPTAYAAEAQGVVLTPASPAPGTDVRLAVRGCSGTTGTAASNAFVADARLVGKDGTLTGDTRVRSALTPGMYAVTVGCDGRKVMGVVTVGGPKASAPTGTAAAPTGTAAAPTGTAAAPTGTAAAPTATGSAPTDTASPGVSASPSAPSSPVAPVHAGGGGTAQASVDARKTGPGTRQAVVGLVLVSVAVVVVVLGRSVRRGRGTE
jgi:hypothetical protein